MLSLSVWQLSWIAVVIFGAFVVRGMSGFGAGMVAVPLLAFAIPLQLAVPLCGMLVFFLFVVLLIRDRQKVLWPELWLLLPPTIIGVVFGLWLFAVLDNRILVMLLGGFLIVYAAYLFLSNVFGMAQLRCSRRWAWPVGFLGSFFDTLFGGGGGTLVVIYVNARGASREAFRATVAALWFFEMIARNTGYAWAGYYDSATITLIALLIPVMWAGTLVGERLGNRIRPEQFARLLALMLFASGVLLLVK